MKRTYSATGVEAVEHLVSELYVEARLRSDVAESSLMIDQTAVGSIVVGRSFHDMAPVGWTSMTTAMS